MYTDEKKKIDYWSLIAGVIFIALGLTIFARPFAAFRSLVMVIGIIALCMGAYHIVLHKQLEKELNMGGYQFIIDAIVDVLVGLLLIFSNSFGFFLIAIAFALWFMVDSAIDIYKTVKANKISKKPYYYLTLICGVLGVVIGIFLFFSPMVSNALVILLIAIYFVIEGIKMIVRAF